MAGCLLFGASCKAPVWTHLRPPGKSDLMEGGGVLPHNEQAGAPALGLVLWLVRLVTLTQGSSALPGRAALL